MSDLYLEKNLKEFEKNQKLRDSFEEITHQQMRSVIDMKNIDKYGLSDEQRENQSLEKAQAETVKIAALLDNANEIQLTDEDKDDLMLRDNRNKNLLLVNNERSGGDSEFMTNVKNAIMSYEMELKYRNQTMGNGDFEETDLTDQIESAIAKAQKAIEQCSLYLGRGKPFFFWRRGRYNMVKDAQARLIKEKENLEELKKSKNQSVDVADAINEEVNILSVMSKSKLERKVDSLRTRKEKQKEEIEALKKLHEEKQERERLQQEETVKRQKEEDERKYKEEQQRIDKETERITNQTKNLQKQLEEGDKLLNQDVFDKMFGTGDHKLTTEQKRDKIIKEVEKLKKDKPLTREQLWAEYAKRAAKYDLDVKEIKEWKAEVLSNERFMETLKDKVEGKVPTDDIDKKMAKRKERLEKEKKEKEEEERRKKEEEERLKKEKDDEDDFEKDEDYLEFEKRMSLLDEEIMQEDNMTEDELKDLYEEKKEEIKKEKEEKAEQERLEKERLEKEEKERLEQERLKKEKEKEVKPQTEQQKKVLTEFGKNFEKVLEKKPINEQAADIARILDSMQKKQTSKDDWGGCGNEEDLLKKYMEKVGSDKFIAEAKNLYAVYEKQLEDEYDKLLKRDIPETLLKDKAFANDPQAHAEAAALCMGRKEAFRRMGGLNKMFELLGVNKTELSTGLGTQLFENYDKATYEHLNSDGVQKMKDAQEAFRQKSADCCFTNYVDPSLVGIQRKSITEKDLDKVLTRLVMKLDSKEKTPEIPVENLPNYEYAKAHQAELEKKYGKLDLKTIAVQKSLVDLNELHDKNMYAVYGTLMMKSEDINGRLDIDNRCTHIIKAYKVDGDPTAFLSFAEGESDMMDEYLDDTMQEVLNVHAIMGDYSIDVIAKDPLHYDMLNRMSGYVEEFMKRSKTKGYFDKLGENAKKKINMILDFVSNYNQAVNETMASRYGFNPNLGDAPFKKANARSSEEELQEMIKEAFEPPLEELKENVMSSFPELFTNERVFSFNVSESMKKMATDDLALAQAEIEARKKKTRIKGIDYITRTKSEEAKLFKADQKRVDKLKKDKKYKNNKSLDVLGLRVYERAGSYKDFGKNEVKALCKELGIDEDKQVTNSLEVDARVLNSFFKRYNKNKKGAPVTKEDKAAKDYNIRFMKAYVARDGEKMRPFLEDFVKDVMNLKLTIAYADFEYLQDHGPEFIDVANKLTYLTNLMMYEPEKSFFATLPEGWVEMLQAKKEAATYIAMAVSLISNYHGVGVTGTPGIKDFSQEGKIEDDEDLPDTIEAYYAAREKYNALCRKIAGQK